MAAPDSRIVRVFAPERLNAGIASTLGDLEAGAVVRRIWDGDWTVWKPEDREISNRLGWLDAPVSAAGEVGDIEAFAAAVRGEGFVRAVVLGMGGSSLAPEVFARSFPTSAGGLELEILDTTEPGAVAGAAARLDVRRTLFLVSSKSGSTAELAALLAFFYDRAVRELGAEGAGRRFAAVTDPGSPLEALAGSLGFRRVFHGRPDVGGRFSALSAFGLLPAGLKGIDLARLLASARLAAGECRSETLVENPGALLGAILGAAALRGLDKLTLLVPPRLAPLAGWLEQLVAESTGKEGRGVVPVVEGRPRPADRFGADRLFVEIGEEASEGLDAAGRTLVDAGHPLVRLSLDDPYDLGGHFFLWEFATAVAGHVLGINPFDQPDVESTKKKTRQVLAGAGGGPAPRLRLDGPPWPAGAAEALTSFFGASRDGDYFALLAFLPPRDEVAAALGRLAASLRTRFGRPVTVGVGPRYLHSTGQLHKGDGNRGLFLMLTGANPAGVPIPEVPGLARPAATFADLFRAQASGDRLALEEKGRRVLTIELCGQPGPALDGLRALLE